MVLATVSPLAFAKGAASKPQIVKAYRVTENGLQEVSIQEYLNHPCAKASGNYSGRSAVKGNINPTGRITADWYRYDESGTQEEVRCSDLRERVSRYIENYTQLPQTYSVEYSAAQGYQINISLTTEEFSAIKAGVSFTWEDYAYEEKTEAMSVNPGCRGWWEFEPIMNNSYGYLKTFSWLGELKTQEWVDAWSPNTLSDGRLDGYLLYMEEPL